MKLPLTFSLYISRHMLWVFLMTIGVILFIIGLIELVELIRRASNARTEVPFAAIIEMALLKLPYTAEKALPFAVLIAAMLALSRLSKSSELIVARASGISVWQFLAPAAMVAMLIGVIFTGIINPLSAAMITRFEALEGKYITNKPSTFSISPSGLWLRHIEADSVRFRNQQVEEYVLHAARLVSQDITLSDVIIFLYGKDHRFIGRIDAAEARLTSGQWQMDQATLSQPGIVPESGAAITLKTQLSVNEIRESFSSPSTLSFWQLSGFIETLEKAGFSALRHKLHWHGLLASPLMLCAMVLLAANFALKHHRRGKVGLWLTFGVLAGFVVYFSSNLIFALGFSGSLPIILAAWSPAFITAAIAMSFLLHVEDG